MKKILLLTTLSVATLFGMAQFPCAEPNVTVTGNNGGGNCQDVGSLKADGKIEVTFAFPASEVPEIVAMYDLNSTTPNVPLDAIFGTGVLSADGLVATYCFYSTTSKHINLVGGKNNYRFELHYPSKVGGLSCDPSNIILPVKLKSFTASRNKTAVGLTWVTATEQNNRGFELQRMIGNGSWTTIAFIFSQADDGNSDVDLAYSYNDHNSYQGVSQYRLVQVDMNDMIKYSDIRSVRGIEQSNKTIVTPNPSSNGNVNVIFEDIKGQKNLLLFDAMGRVVKQWNNYTDNSLQIAGLKTGFYQLSIINKETGVQSVEKIVVAGK